ncbi:serine/threonine-protein phosphatase 6 regulatory ankyrin repeat subunit B-like [Acanthaster planci]|uniref:Serine/threonine-protein phosphatase 6 regulatory ankyrin repeat subunit B-like n=1 Tax=Acanthaster planci TaxID=133434 RepID=A0A8B7ZUK7_ACAPL|nr:serine/threonine-protein phosphatase 6 regulatory ankyrin repeat subunit B-like [Acanthaster planci]
MGNATEVQGLISRNPDLVKYENKQGQTPLHAAAHAGHMETVVALVTSKAQLEKQDKKGYTALASAIFGDEPEIVEYLLESGSKPNASSKMGFTPLHIAAIEGHKKCVEVLLSRLTPSDVDCRDVNGNTPLVIAIAKKYTPIIQLLVEHQGISLDLKDAHQRTPLHIAALCGNKLAGEHILKANPELINVQSQDGFTALHLAAFYGHADTVLTLVTPKNCVKDLRNNRGHTALHLAIINRHYECVKTLVGKGANLNAQDGNGNTGLHLVMMKTSISIENLLEAKLKGKAQTAGDDILQDIFQLLVEHPTVDLSLKNNKDLNCLHYAASWGHKFAVKKIVEAKPSLMNVAQNDGWTALHLAIMNDHTSIVSILVKQELCSKDLKNAKGHTVLHFAVMSDKGDCARILLENGADVNAQDDDGNTSLHLATMTTIIGFRITNEGILQTDKVKESDATRQDMIELLVKDRNANLSLKNNQDFSCLHYASGSGNIYVMNKILEVAPGLINMAKNDGFAPLHLAALNGCTDAVETLVNQGNCVTDLKNVEGQTALHLATSKKNFECVKALINGGANVNAQDKDGDTSLHLVMENLTDKDVKETSGTGTTDEQRIIETLLHHGQIDIGLQNNKGYNCLHYAALNGNRFGVEKILEANPSLIRSTGNDGQTALHIAASNGFADILTALLQKENCGKDIRNASKQTALHLAVDECHLKCIKVLLEYGADVNATDIHESTSLHLAIAKVSMKVSKLSSTKDDGEVDYQFLATIKKYQKVIKLLVERPTVDLTLTDKKGFNCLHSAAINGNSFAVKTMLEAKPSLINTTCTADRGTALHLAVLNNHTDIVAALCEQGCNLNIPNINGQTPLHLAADSCNTKSVEILLNTGANVNAQDKYGDTCLHLLLEKSFKEATGSTAKKQKGVAKSLLVIQNLIRMLLRHGNIDVTLRDNNRDNCLHFAAFSGNDDAVKEILKAKKSVINDRNGSLAPLHIASFYDHADVVQTLAKQGNCNKDLQNSNSQTALHIAIEKNHYKCIEALVNNGANVNAKDNGGNTSLHLVMMKESTQTMLRSASKEELWDVVKKIEQDGSGQDEMTNLVALITSLLKHGANIHLLNNKEQNVPHFAPNSSVQSFLEELFVRFTSTPKQAGT